MRRFCCLTLAFLILQSATAVDAPDEPPPPTADHLLDYRLQLVEQGLARFAPPIQPVEAMLLLPALKARVDTLLTQANGHAAFAKDEPTTVDDYEKLFWSMHVLSNQLSSATRFFDYAQELQVLARKYKPKKNDLIDPAALNIDWAKPKAELSAVRTKLNLRDRDLRIARLKLVDQVLTDSREPGARMAAALALDMDGDTLPALLARDKTFPAEQTKELKQTIAHARTAAGRDLLQKSRALFTGLHWWTRGRYGVGTEGGGLLKLPAALKSADAQFGLLMPIATPIPTPPAANNPVPAVDRRHHYLWQFETMNLNARSEQKSNTTKEYRPTHTNVTTLSHFY